MSLLRRIALLLGLAAVLAHGVSSGLMKDRIAPKWASAIVDATSDSLERDLLLSFCGRATHHDTGLGDVEAPAPARQPGPCLDCCCPVTPIAAVPAFTATPAHSGFATAPRLVRRDLIAAIAERTWRFPPARGPPLTA